MNQISGTENFISGRMSNDIFDAKILAEKLLKLNNSQQSIESLSRWCISHRKRARQIVETWEKLFSSSQKDQCVSFLYLANDILQNSKRKGNEFVNEFWKVLPATLKNVHEYGDEHGRKTVSRLVGIWEERKVFGSRGSNLKEELLGKDPPPPPPQPAELVSNSGKGSNPVKIVKKDASSLRIKLAVGGLEERIMTAFHSVHDESSAEEDASARCNAALLQLERLVKDMENIMAQGIQPGSTLLDRLVEQKNILEQCVKQLETAEASRVALVSQLKEAVEEQESSLETIRSHLQAARDRINMVGEATQTLSSPPHPVTSGNALDAVSEPAKAVEQARLSVQATSSLQFPMNQTNNLLSPPAPQLQPPMMTVSSFAPLATTEEENKKAAAAAVAAKLAASTSSAQMLTSVLSSLVAEEAAARSGNSRKAGFGVNLPSLSPEKRQKVESEASNSDMGGATYFSSLPHPMTSLPIIASSGLQTTQMSGPLPPVPPLPPPPPPPLVPPASSPVNQFAQSIGMLGPTPYGITGASLPPPPPLPFHITMGLPRLPAQQAQPPQTPQQQQQQQLQASQQQQPPATGGYYGNMSGLYGQNHRATTPPIHRQ